MTQYIDGFILPVPRNQLNIYREVVEKVAEIWLEHGALDYSEFVGEDSSLEGTRSFTDVTNARKDEAIIFGWVKFESREARDIANQRVLADPRMPELIDPLMDITRPVFDAKRMVYGGFRSFVQSSGQSTV